VRAYLHMVNGVTSADVDWNDGDKTFLMPGIRLPRREITFEEVRSYTGAIRQIDVRQPLVQATIPLMVKGTDMADLESTLGDIFAGCLAGGVLTFQEATDIGVRGSSISYRVGRSQEPEVVHDSAYRHKCIARFEVSLWVAL